MQTLTLKSATAYALRRIGARGAAFEPFLLGFYHGRTTRLHTSPAETAAFVAKEVAAMRFPPNLPADWETLYLNGRDDGVKYDLTRVALMMEHE